MKTQLPRTAFLAATLAFLWLGAGCSTSGGKQESVINHQIVSRDLKGSVADMDHRLKDVFREMGIEITGTATRNSGKEQDYTGKAGDKTVSIQTNDLGDGMTHVEVVAKSGTLQWNEDYARSVITRLVQKS